LKQFLPTKSLGYLKNIKQLPTDKKIITFCPAPILLGDLCLFDEKQSYNNNIYQVSGLSIRRRYLSNE
jgi:hypothetical protein